MRCEARDIDSDKQCENNAKYKITKVSPYATTMYRCEDCSQYYKRMKGVYNIEEIGIADNPIRKRGTMVYNPSNESSRRHLEANSEEEARKYVAFLKSRDIDAVVAKFSDDKHGDYWTVSVPRNQHDRAVRLRYHRDLSHLSSYHKKMSETMGNPYKFGRGRLRYRMPVAMDNPSPLTYYKGWSIRPLKADREGLCMQCYYGRDDNPRNIPITVNGESFILVPRSRGGYTIRSTENKDYIMGSASTKEAAIRKLRDYLNTVREKSVEDRVSNQRLLQEYEGEDSKANYHHVRLTTKRFPHYKTVPVKDEKGINKLIGYTTRGGPSSHKIVKIMFHKDLWRIPEINSWLQKNKYGKLKNA